MQRSNSMASSFAGKRPRDSSSELEVRGIVSALNQAVTSEQRKNAVKNLFLHLSYNDDSRNFAGKPEQLVLLVKAGATQALCLQLGYVMNKGNSEEEVEQVCRALDVLFRCSRTTRESSMNEIGPDLFALLLRAVSSCQEGTTTREIISIWHTCSGSNRGSLMVLKFPGLLPAIVNVLLDEDDSAVGLQDAKSETLGVIKNVSYYAEDYRLNLLEQPGMLTSLTRATFSSLGEKSMERLSAIFRNLAVAPNARNILARSDVLNALIRLSSFTYRRTTRNTLNTILSLSMETESRILLVLHGEGILLSVLVRLVLEDVDQVVRRRAARALRLLARDQGAPLIVGDTSLIDALSRSALHDKSQDVRFEAAEAFVCCAASVQAQMPHHTKVLEALMSLATSTSVVPDVAARALKEQAGHPNNRVSMANHVGLLSALSQLALSELSSISAKEYATCALRDLSAEEKNRERMATESVLAALKKSTMDARDESNLVRIYATSTLVNLASLASNRKLMVTHTGLLNALVQCAATSTDTTTKSAVKKAILMLVPAL